VRAASAWWRAAVAGGERGSLALELVALTPALLLGLWLFGVFCLRGMLLDGQLDSVAGDAARAASIARTPAAAQIAATRTVAASLQHDRPLCQTVEVRTDTARFHPGGSVRVTLACTIRLHDLGLLAVPGHRTIRASYTVPVDLYRGVGP